MFNKDIVHYIIMIYILRSAAIVIHEQFNELMNYCIAIYSWLYFI